MKDKATADKRRSMSWAGSTSGSGTFQDSVLYDADIIPDGDRRDHLQGIRSKLADSGYLDGAVSRIAGYVCGRKKGGKTDGGAKSS
jgi:hypothetical protein